MDHHRVSGCALAGVRKGMNLPRIFASAVARRLAYVLVALALGLMGIGTARAQSTTYSDQGAAYAAAHAWGAAQRNTLTTPNRYYDVVANGCGSSQTCSYTARYGPNPGYVQAVAHFYYPRNQACASRPPMQNVRFTGNSGTCSGGCSFAADTDGGSVQVFTIGGQQITLAALMTPTGQACTVAEMPEPIPSQDDSCIQHETLTQCVKPDGRTCAKSSSGKEFCWQPTEHGTKTSGNEAATKSPSTESVNIPPVAPPNGGDWKQQAQSTVTINNNTSNVTNWQSSYGNQGGGAAGGGADGQPNGGNGDGAGDGDGDGDDHGTVSGGATCEQPLSCAGGDPVLCAIAQQQYLARCEASGRGDGEVSPFPGTGDGGAGDDPSPADSHKTASPGLGWIDTTGILGGGSCPQFESVTTQFGDFAINGDDWCQIIGIARAALLIFGAFIALGILMGWGGKD